MSMRFTINGQPWEIEQVDIDLGSLSIDMAASTILAQAGIKVAAISASPPAPPTNLTAVAAGATSIFLTWDLSPNREAGGVLYRSENGTDYSQVTTLFKSVSRYTDTADSNVNHWYKLVAENHFGQSTPVIVAYTAGSKPAAPSNLAATANGTHTIDLAFTNNDPTNTDYLNVYRSSTSGVAGFSLLGPTPDGTAATYSDTSCAPATQYWYYVTAVNTYGESDPSTVSTATTGSSGSPPAAPSGLTVDAATSSDRLTYRWTDNSDNELNFVGEISLSGAGSWSTANTVGAGIMVATATGLAPSTAYDIRVKATNASGDSAWSNTATGTTAALNTGVLPVFPISTTNVNWAAYKSSCLKTDPSSYGQNPFTVAQAWIADGRTNTTMRDWCVTKIRSFLTTDMAAWNAGQNVTRFSSDSYLYAGDTVKSYLYPAQLFADQFTAQELADIGTLVGQCVYNIQNPTLANWNGTAFHWSGWSLTDPMDNYYHRAHLPATMLWAIYSQNQTYLTKTADMIALFKTEYAKCIGGGPKEGTGYGNFVVRALQNAWMYRTAFGIDIAADILAPDQVEYWVQMLTPDRKYQTPIGDANLTGVGHYQLTTFIWGHLLGPEGVKIEHGRWMLNQIGLTTQNYYYFENCIDAPGTQTQPTTKLYHASGVGHMFIKGNNNDYIALRAGEYSQSHDHKNQGDTQLYIVGSGTGNQAWALIEASALSHSGILQQTKYHNCIVFQTSTGTYIEPLYKATPAPVMVPSDDGNIVTVTCDLKPAYSNTASIVSYTRTWTINRTAKTMTVADVFVTTGGTVGLQRWTTNRLPVDQGNGSYLSGVLTITGNGTPNVVNWKTEQNVGVFDNDCWRIDFSGRSDYTVTFSW